MRYGSLAIILTTASAAWGVAVDDTDSARVDDLLTQATEAAAAGDAAGRAAALGEALEIDPANPAAHAESGEVLLEGRWLPVAYAQHLANRDVRIAEYRRRRRESGESLREQRELAKWCTGKGLEYEARPHWLAILGGDPDDRAALQALDAVWHEGRLTGSKTVEKLQKRADSVQEAERRWDQLLRKIDKAYRVEERLWDCFDNVDVGLIRPIEARIASIEQAPPQRLERLQRAIDLYLEAATSAPGEEFTASLCRIAVMPGDASLRRRAAVALQQRPEVDAIPMLLEALIAPIDSEYRITRDRTGNVAYEHRLSHDSAERKQEHLRARLATVSVGLSQQQVEGYASFTTDASFYRALLQARFEGLKKQIEFQDEAASTTAFIDAHNQVARALNERTIVALALVTNAQLGDAPDVWWDYWRRLSGYDTYTEAPVERTYDYTRSHDYVTATPTYVPLPPPPPVPRCECFVAGTLVWTRTGQLPIDQIREGDLVLARDAEEGGLTFRSVTGTTQRDPSPTVTITTSKESITATEGHPFWVVGAGWRMARELREGDVLSTVSGPVAIVDTNPAADQTAYNLIVEGAANYYVGEAGVLVHDNTPRRPATGLVVRR